MRRMRGAVTYVCVGVRVCVAAVVVGGCVVAAAGCGGGGKAMTGAAGAGGGAADGGAGAGGGTAGQTDAGSASDARADLATDFGVPGPGSDSGAATCPAADGALAAAPAELVIDDFDGTGKLDGRIRKTGAFSVREQFDATADAKFSVTSIEPACGAAAPGAAHISGTAADTGATFALVFSTPGEGGAAVARYDASGTKGITFRMALGRAKVATVFGVQVNLAGSTWDYAKDVIVPRTTWQTVTVLWSDLQAAPNADAFDPSKLNQIVFPFASGDEVDLFIDDIAFVK